MNKVQANLSNSKELQALRAQFSGEELPTEIVEGNKHCYNFLGYTIATNGSSVRLDWKLFSMTKELYQQHEIKKTLKAANFGHAALIILHDPVLMEKKEKEAKEKTAKDLEEKEKAEKKEKEAK